MGKPIDDSTKQKVMDVIKQNGGRATFRDIMNGIGLEHNRDDRRADKILQRMRKQRMIRYERGTKPAWVIA